MRERINSYVGYMILLTIESKSSSVDRLTLSPVDKAKESFDRDFDQGPGFLEDTRMTRDQLMARGKSTAASM